MDLGFDLRSTNLIDDPYRHYRVLREHEPVRWQPLDEAMGGTWLVCRYRDAKEVLQHKDISRVVEAEPGDVMSRSMLFRDPPDHTRLRGLVSLAFTPKMVRRLESRIDALVDHLLDRVQPVGAADLITDLALPLPIIVIAETLGVPADDRDMFRKWSSDVVDGADALGGSQEKVRRGQEAKAELTEYFRELIDQRRHSPRDDLISALIVARDEQGTLDRDELLGTCLALLIAGHDTTVGLIGNGIFALLRHPDQLTRLRSDPDLIDSAIEEMLRFESPLQRVTFRYIGEGLTLGGKRIAAGDHVSAVVGAANRDPEQFPNPDAFDIGRQPNRHLAFGRGIHFCLGAPLARAEARIAVSRVVSRLSSLELSEGDVRWRENTAFRALGTLPVRFQPSDRAV